MRMNLLFPRRRLRLSSCCRRTLPAVLVLCSATLTVRAQPAAASGEAPVQLDKFVVSGLRGSLAQALEIKRESVQLVESIVAEDIGKFPDNNLIEAMQRMTGVQVTNRGGGEISGVSIRGLPDINTTLNGQNIFTASGQAVALQDIPASLLSRVDVYKTRSADLIETGIAGSMDIRTHRPFDFKGRRMALAARAIYQEQSEKIGPNFSVMASNQWTLAGGAKFGALLNVSYVRTPYRDQNVTAGAMVPFVTANPPPTPPVTWVPYQRIFPRRPGVAENPIWQPGLERGLPFAANSTLRINGVEVPYLLGRDAVFQNDFTGTRERPGGNLALQWAPDEKSVYTFEAFYTGFRNKSFNNLLFSFVDWWGGPHGAVTLYPGTNIIKSRERVSFPYMFTSGDLSTGKTDSYFYSLSGQWDLAGSLKLRSALSYQDSVFRSTFLAMRADRVAPSVSVDFNIGGGLTAFRFPDDPATPVNEADLTNAQLWNVAQLYDNANRNKGDAWTWTMDGDYTPKSAFLTRVKFGARYDVRRANEAQRTQDAGSLRRPLSDFPELWHVNKGFFDGRSDVPRAWVVPNGYAIQANADRYRGLYQARFPHFRLGNQLSLFKNFAVEETTSAAYLRADFKSFPGGRKLDGQLGVRYVNVETDMNTTDRATLARSAASVSKDKLLPSASLRYQITPDLIARASYAETLRRPGFGALNPFINYVQDVTNIGYGTASGGNPRLRPTESRNYDLALEWYFGKSSSIYGTLFRREIDGLVVSFRRRVTAIVPPRTTPYDYILTQPDNASNGVLEGFELGAVYFPDNLPGPLQGLGVHASYTALDSQQDIPETDSVGNVVRVLTRDFFGVSDKSYSVVLAYERPRFNGRLSYVWRSAFLNNYEAALFANPLGVYRRPEESLDLQLTFRVHDNFALTFDATNLTEELYQSYYQYPDTNNFSSSLYSRTFALGARYSF